ncbi:MAG TPA: YciI family protein [Actinomycetota bacterium]|nr:YciI family protein [Actinomycetota bacterium]
MRFMLFVKANEGSEAGELPDDEGAARVGELIEEMAAAGVLLAAEGLKPSSAAKRVTYSEGKVSAVTDGPFAEAKELVAGFCWIDVPSWDQALAWTTRFAAAAGEGVVEIRPLYEVSDFPEDVLPPEAAAREQSLRDALTEKLTAH